MEPVTGFRDGIVVGPVGVGAAVTQMEIGTSTALSSVTRPQTPSASGCIVIRPTAGKPYWRVTATVAQLPTTVSARVTRSVIQIVERPDNRRASRPANPCAYLLYTSRCV